MLNTLDRMMTLNRALDRALGEGANGNLTPFWVPALDVAERGDAYLIVAELPGVDPQSVDLSFEHNVLTIRGTKAATFETRENEQFRIYTAERRSGAFERAVRLPSFVDSERIEAEFRHGVLMITVPKSEAAKPRRIEIRAASGELNESSADKRLES